MTIKLKFKAMSSDHKFSITPISKSPHPILMSTIKRRVLAPPHSVPAVGRHFIRVEGAGGDDVTGGSTPSARCFYLVTCVRPSCFDSAGCWFENFLRLHRSTGPPYVAFVPYKFESTQHQGSRSPAGPLRGCMMLTQGGGNAELKGTLHSF